MIRELKNGGAVNPGNSRKTRPTSAMPMPMPVACSGVAGEESETDHRGLHGHSDDQRSHGGGQLDIGPRKTRHIGKQGQRAGPCPGLEHVLVAHGHDQPQHQRAGNETDRRIGHGSILYSSSAKRHSTELPAKSVMESNVNNAVHIVLFMKPHLTRKRGRKEAEKRNAPQKIRA